jgi:hypothetical protein
MNENPKSERLKTLVHPYSDCKWTLPGGANLRGGLDSDKNYGRGTSLFPAASWGAGQRAGAALMPAIDESLTPTPDTSFAYRLF